MDYALAGIRLKREECSLAGYRGRIQATAFRQGLAAASPRSRQTQAAVCVAVEPGAGSLPAHAK